MPDDLMEILYEEGPCLVVNKPGGILTQAPPGIDSVESRVRALLAARDGLGVPYVGVPHRLDRGASGAMVFGKSRKATRRLAEQFEGRLVGKIYWALVEGQVAPPAGTWNDYVRKIPGQARAETVDVAHPEGRDAVLHYRVLAQVESGTWLEIRLETGRTHQIRVQAASRGHPVLGDLQYGASQPFGPSADDRTRCLALHARRLLFRHPATRVPVDILAPLPATWDELQQRTTSRGS
jgi:RluA family pseudouridine synthase